MTTSPLAGKPAPKDMLIDVARHVCECYTRRPDLDDPQQRVLFGTSGHRGTPLDGSFTEAHILAITQAGPSGTEAVYKIYAESFKDEAHLARLVAEAQAMVDHALAA
jgi:phosphoglucomutase